MHKHARDVSFISSSETAILTSWIIWNWGRQSLCTTKIMHGTGWLQGIGYFPSMQANAVWLATALFNLDTQHFLSSVSCWAGFTPDLCFYSHSKRPIGLVPTVNSSAAMGFPSHPSQPRSESGVFQSQGRRAKGASHLYPPTATRAIKSSGKMFGIQYSMHTQVVPEKKSD